MTDLLGVIIVALGTLFVLGCAVVVFLLPIWGFLAIIGKACS